MRQMGRPAPNPRNIWLYVQMTMLSFTHTYTRLRERCLFSNARLLIAVTNIVQKDAMTTRSTWPRDSSPACTVHSGSVSKCLMH